MTCTTSTIKTWRCDGCGISATQKGGDTLEIKDWAQMSFRRNDGQGPLFADGSAIYTRLNLDLCLSCTESLIRRLNSLRQSKAMQTGLSPDDVQQTIDLARQHRVYPG